MKTLIVNADDFGLCEGVNAAILDAYATGSLSSTTLLVNGNSAAAAAQLARQHPGLGVGLHFNLTLGRPSADPQEIGSLLLPGGEFPARGALARRLMLGRVSSAQLTAEFDAQLAAFSRLGLVPSHIDSHQHVHAFPQVFDVLAQVCAERSLPLRQPWVARPSGAHPRLGRALRTGLLACMNARNQRRWQGRLRSNEAFTSVFDLGAMPSRLDASHYRTLLGAAQAFPCELMVHLSRRPDDVAGLTRIGDVSHAEWQCLSEGVLAGVIAEQGWQLRSYRDAFDEGKC
ncbi:hypothetical protein DFR29_120111 [Tahibacter aquaticus]|uniref:Glycoside hydrolase/deacetylase ChbG (UPF0249 family) n=1 Tax=Tahibacter aquaticus TaxID=520092 RepID=A0A4R6YMV7_9GAMM|nr:ChbG/HpnK family deacetylase [Tahibacter aquaticus]TDR38610.1 hypothetical protein DFR29_120111 [Tahibacter aquaticus]